MSHCINCGKPADKHVLVEQHSDPDSPVYVCPTSTYDEVDDNLISDELRDPPPDEPPQGR
jgi:hypothetical protein